MRGAVGAVGDQEEDARTGVGGRRVTGNPAAWVLLALALTAAAACGGGASEPPPTTEPLTADQAETAAYLSDRTMELWVVYNSYDLDGLRAFYEESYWSEQEEELRRNMAPFESRGTTFTAEETSPPRETEPGKWELTHTARFSGGSLNMRFIYEQFDGEWLLTHAEID